MKDSERAVLEVFCSVVDEWVAPKMPPIEIPAHLTPQSIYARLRRDKPGLADRSLQMSVTDNLELLQDLRGAELRELDALLASRGAPTLSAMRTRSKRHLSQLLKREALESDEEFRALAVVLSAIDNQLTPKQVQAANKLLAEYEASR